MKGYILLAEKNSQRNSSHLEGHTWYVTLIASYYLVLCSAATILIFHGYFHPGRVHTRRELFTVGAAIAAAMYWFNPRLGRFSLIGITSAVILAIGESDPSATGFHLTILALLILPSFTRRSARSQIIIDI